MSGQGEPIGRSPSTLALAKTASDAFPGLGILLAPSAIAGEALRQEGVRAMGQFCSHAATDLSGYQPGRFRDQLYTAGHPHRVITTTGSSGSRYCTS